MRALGRAPLGEVGLVRFVRIILCSAVLVGATGLLSPGATATDAAGGWQRIGSLPSSTSETDVFELPDGSVLAIADPGIYARPYVSAQLDRTTNQWASRPITVARDDDRAAQLADGRVILTGGRLGIFSPTDYDSTEVFDHTTRAWAAGPPLLAKRFDHAAARLTDGRVLVAGGRNNAAGYVRTTEFLDPTGSTWTPGPQTVRTYYNPTLYPLPGGGALLLGTSGAEVYDPDSAAWRDLGDPVASNYRPSTALPDGRVAFFGVDGNGTQVHTFDPATENWGTLPPLRTARGNPAVGLLPDGRILVAGGVVTDNTSGDIDLRTAEILDVGTGTWSHIAHLHDRHNDAAMAVLSDGTVLVVGGFTASTEMFDPVVPAESDSFSITVDSTSERRPSGTHVWFRAWLQEVTSDRFIRDAPVRGYVTHGPNQGMSSCDYSGCVTNSTGRADIGIPNLGGPGIDTLVIFYDVDGDGLPGDDETQRAVSIEWDWNRTVLRADRVATADGSGVGLARVGASLSGVYESGFYQGEYLLSGRTLRFTVGGQLICEAVTVDGRASCPDNTGHLAALVVNNGYEVAFAGETHFRPSTTRGRILG